VPGLALGPAVIAARQAGLLINGGGHAMAAGFTVAADKLDRLREFSSSGSATASRASGWCPELSIDGALSAAGAQGGVIEHIAALAPFGAANPEPRFAFPSVQVAFVEPVGTGHVRCTLADPIGPARLKAIAFSRCRDAARRVSRRLARARNPSRPAICAATTTAAATRCSW